jgi:hypothetical protein
MRPPVAKGPRPDRCWRVAGLPADLVKLLVFVECHARVGRITSSQGSPGETAGEYIRLRFRDAA